MHAGHVREIRPRRVVEGTHFKFCLGSLSLSLSLSPVRVPRPRCRLERRRCVVRVLINLHGSALMCGWCGFFGDDLWKWCAKFDRGKSLSSAFVVCARYYNDAKPKSRRRALRLPLVAYSSHALARPATARCSGGHMHYSDARSEGKRRYTHTR